MGIETAIAIASLAIGGASYVSAQRAQNDAQDDRQRAFDEQTKAKNEQKAMQAAQSAQEQRQQIREERVRRAKMLQTSENSGAEYSSSESGALGSLSTTLGSNLGFNAGQVNSAKNITDLNQSAANLEHDAQNSLVDAQRSQSLFALSGSIFSASGGVGSLKKIGK